MRVYKIHRYLCMGDGYSKRTGLEIEGNKVIEWYKKGFHTEVVLNCGMAWAGSSPSQKP